MDTFLALESCNVDDESRVVKERLQFGYWVRTNLRLGSIYLLIILLERDVPMDVRDALGAGMPCHHR